MEAPAGTVSGCSFLRGSSHQFSLLAAAGPPGACARTRLAALPDTAGAAHGVSDSRGGWGGGVCKCGWEWDEVQTQVKVFLYIYTACMLAAMCSCLRRSI